MRLGVHKSIDTNLYYIIPLTTITPCQNILKRIINDYRHQENSRGNQIRSGELESCVGVPKLAKYRPLMKTNVFPARKVGNETDLEICHGGDKVVIHCFRRFDNTIEIVLHSQSFSKIHTSCYQITQQLYKCVCAFIVELQSLHWQYMPKSYQKNQIKNNWPQLYIMKGITHIRILNFILSLFKVMNGLRVP